MLARRALSDRFGTLALSSVPTGSKRLRVHLRRFRHGRILAASAPGPVLTHVVDTAFAVKGHNGNTHRQRSMGPNVTLDAPFLWPASSDPPSLDSLHGQDMFVETDCTPVSYSAGAEAHLMIYDDTWTTEGPWRDMVTRVCRQ